MRLLIVILVAASISASAQQAEPILFREKVFDFGDVEEKGGNVEHEFIFTNNASRSIRILSVQASCGCTTPGWTKDAISPGGNGSVKASFDPKGRPGYFNKSLTVTTDLDASSLSLQIKGQVVDEKTDNSAIEYPIESGSLRFKFASFPLGKLFINRKAAAKTFPVYNAGSKAINFNTRIVGPAYILVEVPKQLKPKEAGTVRITYDAKLRNQYGFVSDNVEITTDDEKMPVKSFSVYATLEEFFPPLSVEELAMAPALQLEQTSIDIGRIRQGTTLEREIILKNTGKKELQIKAVQPNCTCVTIQLQTSKIKVNEEGKLKITFHTEGRTGIQQKALTIYSNDPKDPVQRVTLSGYVEAQ